MGQERSIPRILFNPTAPSRQYMRGPTVINIQNNYGTKGSGSGYSCGGYGPSLFMNYNNFSCYGYGGYDSFGYGNGFGYGYGYGGCGYNVPPWMQRIYEGSMLLNFIKDIFS